MTVLGVLAVLLLATAVADLVFFRLIRPTVPALGRDAAAYLPWPVRAAAQYRAVMAADPNEAARLAGSRG